MVDAVYEATVLAKKSQLSQRHGAVIVRNGEIVGQGYNKIVTHLYHVFSMHAEISCLLNMKKRYSSESKSKKWLKDCRMYVVRIAPDSKFNTLRMSKPCINCQNAIVNAGIPITLYSNEISPDILNA
jgi:deoxycytidylate deaminase